MTFFKPDVSNCEGIHQASARIGLNCREPERKKLIRVQVYNAPAKYILRISITKNRG
jgi:hypothetical protein